MVERVSIQVWDKIADVRLNRPDKLNAIDPDMFIALVEAGKRVSTDRKVRAVVLSGEGRAFCAGLDFESFKGMAGAKTTGTSVQSAIEFDADQDSPANLAQRCAYIWQEIPVPVIAAIHGFAYGGGLQIAMGADIRLIRKDAKMSIMEIKWGLIPDMSGTQTLRYLLRLDVIKELTFTGKIVQGEEAVRLGLATRLSDDPLQDAFVLAAEIAAKSPHAVRAAKRLLNHSVNCTLQAGLHLEAELQKTLMGTPNQVEAVMSNLQKRTADYIDPD